MSQLKNDFGDIFNLLHLLLVLFAGYSQGEYGCRAMQYLDCIQNKTLTGYAIKTSKIPVPALEMCQNQCFEEDQCVSYNLGPADGAIRTCELNAADHWMNVTALVDKRGFEYCPIENPCSSSPCAADSNRICTPDFTKNTYSCDDGAWSQWSSWSSCPSACYSATPKRTRTCTNPAPQNNGANCKGPAEETKPCDTPPLQNCKVALGMESRAIADSQITASSTFHLHAAKDGRLNEQKTGSSTGGWCAASQTTGDHFQVDLQRSTYITGIATQSRPSETFNGLLLKHWITKYGVSFSDDGNNWTEYGSECTKEFFGNTALGEDIVINTLVAPIKARYIRVIVKAFEGYPCMRMELYGCQV